MTLTFLGEQFSGIKYTTVSCGHHHLLSPELFTACKTEILYPAKTQSPFPLLPQPPNPG